jgi:hypothetical protein
VAYHRQQEIGTTADHREDELELAIHAAKELERLTHAAAVRSPT